ncbi:MAG TPA: LamG-like jellyroll fold domain-containing protein, partial [Pirellulales bacterium]
LSDTQLPTGTIRRMLPLPKLDALFVYGCEITRDDLLAIVTLKNLHILGLRGASIGDDDMPLLEPLPELRHIYLYEMPLTNAGLATVIRAMPSLESLGIAKTKIDQEGLKGLSALKNLKWLDINYNPAIADGGASWFPDLPHLEWMNLEGTKINDDSLEALAKLPAITELLLSNNPISDRGLKHLSRLGTLKHIGLNQTRITAAGIADFKRSLPSCRLVFEPSPVDPADAPVANAPDAAKPMPPAAMPDPAAKAAAAPLAGRQPVPDKEAVEKARRELQSRFKAEWTGGKNAGSKRLAARELENAATAADAGAVEKWVLLSQAIDVWAAAADYDAAANTADLLAAQFDVSALSLKAGALRGVSRAAKSEEKPKVIDQALRLVLEAIDRDEYDAADELIKLAIAAARSAGGRARAETLKLAAKDVTALARQFAEVKTDAERLRSAVDDAAANLAVGKFDCEAKHDWARGLPRLAKGTDPALADLAKKDLAQPADAGQIREIAAAWLAAAERANVKLRAAYQERAVYWLAAARRASNEAAREDIDKRIAVIEAAATYRARPFRWCEELLLGVEYAGEIDCGAAARRFELGPTFELGKSWTLDLEFNAPAEISTGQLFFIGDDRGGRDPLFVRLEENRHLVEGVCDATSNEGGGYATPFTKDDVGKWKCVRVSYDGGSRAMMFEVDGKRVAEGVLTFTPTIDVAMPIWIGGVNANDQRFRGKVRRIRLRNTRASLGLE